MERHCLRNLFPTAACLLATLAISAGPYGGGQQHAEAPSHPVSQPHIEAPSHAVQPKIEQHAARQPTVNYYNRIPSLSRQEIKPFHAMAKPSAQQVQKNIKENKPLGTIEQVKQPNRTEIRSLLKPYILPKQTGTNEKLVQKQKNFQNNYPQFLKKNQQYSKSVGEHIGENHSEYKSWFKDDFFKNHHYNPYWYKPDYNWWVTPRWYDVNLWLGWGWDYPIYYDDEGSPIQLPGGYNSYSQPVAEETPTQDDWMPLGVFAAGMSVDQAMYSNMIVQLAFNKEGDVAGTYYNASTDETYELDGMVDIDTQQVVWRLTNNPDSPIMRTGLYDLTQDVAPVAVEFPDGTQQEWVLVRLHQ